jgi:hypothetical protein
MQTCFQNLNFSAVSKHKRAMLVQTYRLKNSYVLGLLASYQRNDSAIDHGLSDVEIPVVASLAHPLQTARRRYEGDKEFSRASNRALRRAGADANRKERLDKDPVRPVRVTRLYGEWVDSD